MSKMVERVAAVIAAEIMELTAEQRTKFQFPDDANGDTCERARSAARLAITAMREPTQAMKQAGAMAMPDYDPNVDDAADVWQKMLDEVLK